MGGRCPSARRARLTRDVVIVGGGVVGTAIARELSQFELRCTLLEAGPDVGAGTSKANTALLHTGFDAKPGTFEARLVPRGHELLSAYAQRVGIPVARTGALLVAWSDEQRNGFPGIVEGARENGYDAVRELSAAGVPVRAMLAPIIPGLTDCEIPAILAAIKEAGAIGAGFVMLRLPFAVAPIFMNWLRL